jgi:DNA end-binding protein Ku
MFTAEHEHEVHFHQLNTTTGHRIRYLKVDDVTGKEVDADHIVRAIEVSARGKKQGSWVTLDDDELQRIQPPSTRTVDIEDFVDLAEIDPIYFDRTYFLAPADDIGARRAYALLLDAMGRSGRAGIGKVVIRNKQYLAAIRPYEMGQRKRLMVMSTMHFADEVADPTRVDDLEFDVPKAETKTRQMAESLIESLAGPFEPKKYRDTYTDELHALIERKADGDDLTVEDRPEPAAPVADLLAALQESLEAAKRTRERGARPDRSAARATTKHAAASKPRKRVPAKKSATSKKTSAATSR